MILGGLTKKKALLQVPPTFTKKIETTQKVKKPRRSSPLFPSQSFLPRLHRDIIVPSTKESKICTALKSLTV